MVVEVDGASTWRGADSRETGTCARADTVTADFSRETPAATTATKTTMPTMVPMAATGAVSMLSLASMVSNLLLRLTFTSVSMVSSFCWGLARGRGGGVGAGVVIVVC